MIRGRPGQRDDKDAPVVTHSRAYLDELGIPVWSGQITQRAGFSLSLASGATAPETEPHSAGAAEIVRLWLAIERSVGAINAAQASRSQAA